MHILLWPSDRVHFHQARKMPGVHGQTVSSSETNEIYYHQIARILPLTGNLGKSKSEKESVFHIFGLCII